MNAATVFFRLLRVAPRRAAARLLVLLLAGGLTDGIGLLLLIPLLQLLTGSSGGGTLPGVLRLLQRTGWTAHTASMLALFVALVALRAWIQMAREEAAATLQNEVVDRWRLRCFEALQHAEWRWWTATRRSDHADLLLADIQRVGNGVFFGLQLAAGGVTLGAWLLAAFALSAPMTLAALLGGLVVYLGLSRLRRGALGLGHGLTAASRAMHGNVQESLSGIKLAKIFGAESRHLQQLAQTVATLRAQQLRFVAVSARSRALIQVGAAVLLSAYVYLGLELWHTPVAVLLTLVLIFSRMLPQWMAIHQSASQLLHAVSAMLQVQQLLADCEAHAESVSADEGAPATWPLADAIRLDGITVHHAGREAPALRGVSVNFRARTTTAVMGASGAGKSTLADVLTGLLAPDAGTLSVDGVAVSSAARRAWRRQVAYVPQEVFLFHDTIRHNLAWACPGASEAQLRDALTRAAAEFVFALPAGMDTVVGDGGLRLSAGERQRIALARALLGRPSLLVLDEATSALDVESEARIRRALERLHGDLTLVIIGHRLPTLEHADQVIVLAAGRLVAQGTWDEVREPAKAVV